MASKAVRINEGILAWLTESEAGVAAQDSYREGEDPAATLYRHLNALKRQSDGSVLAAGLTSDELETLRDAADRIMNPSDVREGETPPSRGLRNSARVLMRQCAQAIAAGPPLVSSINPEEQGPLVVEIEQDPLVALLAAADKQVEQLKYALALAEEQKREIRRLRDEKIAHLAENNKPTQLGKRFNLKPPQVSRIISDRRDAEQQG
ncbi:hypothetical protein [Amycolatopsis sp. NPDC004079]|uniref:hypothetical protein n=1 Tax=Amycolatopsis sp. NPDC004079 TaxID=3154549 RepID=UPI0033A8072C